MSIDQDVAGYHDVISDVASRSAKPATDPMPPTQSPPELRTLLGIAIAALVISALYFGKDVFIPITLAVVLSFVLAPLVDLLQRARLWRGPAVFFSVIGALGVIALVATLIGSQAASLAGEAPRYAQTIEGKVQKLETMATTRVNGLTSRLGIDLPNQQASAGAQPAPAQQGSAENGGQNSSGQQPTSAANTKSDTASPLTVARTLVGPILGPLETTIIVFVVAIFVLMQKEDLRDRFVRLFGAQDLYRTTLAIDDGARRLSRYFVAQLAVNSSFGLVIGIGLWMIGIPSAAMWGVLAGLLRFVPYIGSFLAAIAPMALAAAIEPGWSSVIYVALLFGVIEPITGYALEPMLYGHSTGLSPISVIVAALFWTWLWGPVGLIMSTPLTLCLVVTGRHVKSLEFFDILLGDRPALSPVEMFYQRLLAAHGDAMLACAQAMLQEATLIEFYDDVVLPALRLAARDHASGRMDEDRYQAIDTSLRGLIATLGRHEEGKEGKENTGATSGLVLCVPGEGPFDGALCEILARMVRDNGRPAQLTPPVGADVTGEIIDAPAAAILCQNDPETGPAARSLALQQLALRHEGIQIGFGFGPIGKRQVFPVFEGHGFTSLAQAIGWLT